LILSAAGLFIGFTFGYFFDLAKCDHDYHPFGTTPYLYDTHTGRVCAPLRESEDAYKKATVNPTPGSPLGDVFDQAAKLPHGAADMIPACE